MTMNYDKRLSIIVPVYNVEKYLERCITSLLNQDLPKDDYEVIMVNDGSTDGSGDLATRLATLSPNISLYHQENKGLSGARNTGIEHAKGRYLMFVDSDDYIEANSISRILQSAETRNLDLLAFSICRRSKDNQINWLHTMNDYLDDSNIIDGISLLRAGFEPTSVCTYLYKTDFLNRYTFRFKEGIVHEDIEFNYRVIPKVSRAGSVDILVYNYCLNDGHSITTGRTLRQEANAMMSNMEIAASIKSYIRQEDIPNDIFKRFDSCMNSMLINQIVSLFIGRGRKLPFQFIKEYINKSKELKVYPIKGYNAHFRSKIARLIINTEPVLIFLVRIIRK